MSGKWHDISSAPHGQYKTKRIHTATGVHEQVFIEPVWVWTWRHEGKHMTKSHWIPEQPNGDGGRWNGYPKDKGPDLWQQYRPDPPEDASE